MVNNVGTDSVNISTDGELSQTSTNTYRNVVVSLPALTPNPRRFDLHSSVQPLAERSSVRHASDSASGNVPGNSSTNMTRMDETADDDDNEGFTTYRSRRRRRKPAIVSTRAGGILNVVPTVRRAHIFVSRLIIPDLSVQSLEDQCCFDFREVNIFSCICSTIEVL